MPDFSSVGLRLGDIGIAFWKDKAAVFVYADKGPANALGEGSIKLAQLLGIAEDPRVGGYNEEDLHNMGRGVTHIVFPGSTDAAPARPERNAMPPRWRNWGANCSQNSANNNSSYCFLRCGALSGWFNSRKRSLKKRNRAAAAFLPVC